MGAEMCKEPVDDGRESRKMSLARADKNPNALEGNMPAVNSVTQGSYNLNVLVLGDSGVGKSALIDCFMTKRNQRSIRHEPTQNFKKSKLETPIDHEGDRVLVSFTELSG